MPKPVKIGGGAYKVPAAEEIVQTTIGRPKTVGKSGLGLRAFMFSLFKANEEWLMTDGQLLSIMEQEYADQPKVLKRFERKGIVASHRSKYNNGYYGPITLYSFRYNHQSKPLKRGCISTYDSVEMYDVIESKCPTDSRLKPPPKPRRTRRKSK